MSKARILWPGCLFIIFICSFISYAATIYVPDNYPTIQAAITASANGDEVVVRDGIYTGTGNRDISFLGKAITVRSENGPESCIVDCQGSAEECHRGFIFETNENENSILDGFTIINGYTAGCLGNYGGGILCKYTSPVIQNCIIQECISTFGSGIYCNGKTNDHSTPLIFKCIISDNKNYSRVSGFGGGIYLSSSDAIIEQCTINNNISYLGGGIYSLYSDITINNCIVENNKSTGGGGIDHRDGNITLSNCVIAKNGMRDENNGQGGGIYITNTPVYSAMITNCAITDNCAGKGGGLFCEGPVTVMNSILWDNFAGTGHQIYIDDSPLAVNYCDIEGGQLGLWLYPYTPENDKWDHVVTLDWGENNIDSDPLFTLSGNYQLQYGSPCIDAGDGDSAPSADIDSHIRFDDPNTINTGDGTPAYVDMGAHEYQGAKMHLILEDSEFYCTHYKGCNLNDKILVLENKGDTDLDWSINEDADWLTVTPSSGTTAQCEEITLHVDVNDLPYGIYRCEMIVTDLDVPSGPRHLIITLEYDDGCRDGQEVGYVIITTDSIAQASEKLQDFIALKEWFGFTVKVVTEATAADNTHYESGGTADQRATNIRTWLLGHYEQDDIEYVLLIGNPTPEPTDFSTNPETYVPMKMSTCGNGIPTDFYYADLTYDWSQCDDFRPLDWTVLVGRIPYYGSIEDLDSILERTIQYQIQPGDQVQWRKNVLLPADSGLASSYKRTEWVKRTAIKKGWDYHRLYDYGVVPEIPLPETNPCTIETVTDVWKGGQFGLVAWSTHGGPTIAGGVMDTVHVPELNDNFPAFTCQDSCLTAYPENSNNLTYELLKHGAICTIGAARTTGGGLVEDYCSLIINCNYSSGRALCEARRVMGRSLLEYAIYGDPDSYLIPLHNIPPVYNSDRKKWYGAIQDAIDDADDLDEIVVYPGTYYENVNFNGKNITVRSVDPLDWEVVESTLIKGAGDSVVTLGNGGYTPIHPVLRGFTVTGGTHGISCVGTILGKVTVSNCIIQDNIISGIKILHCGNSEVNHCIVKQNGNEGIAVSASTVSIKNSLIYENLTGLSIGPATATILHCTIVDNENYGVLSTPPYPVTIKNCILWNDSDDLENCTATYSCVKENNDEDPQLDDSYHIVSSDSPCIDTGDNSVVVTGDVDIDGEDRILDGDGDETETVDIGADEFKALVFNETQQIWYLTIQSAINAAVNGDVIVVSPGAYYENVNFNGKNITVQSLDPDDWEIVENTVIEGTGTTNAVQLGSGASHPILSGLTVTGGTRGVYCMGTTYGDVNHCILTGNSDAGVLLYGANAVVTNCVINDNGSKGISVGSASGTFRNNLIYGNSIGVEINTYASSTIYNCTIADNTYGITKPQMYAGATIKNCILWNNIDDLENCTATYSCVKENNDEDPQLYSSYQISSSLSPCIDTGDPNGVYTGWVDIDGEDRVMDGDGDETAIVDMGADEYNPD